MKPGALTPAPVDLDPEKLTLVQLPQPVFNWLRSRHLDPRIMPGTPLLRVAVLADDYLVGVAAFVFDMHGAKFPNVTAPTAFLMCDFAVTQLPRAAKLVVMAALSEEMQTIVERSAGRRMRSVATAVFSDKPISMKYRGVFEVLRRVEHPDGGRHRYQLSYGADFTGDPLVDVLASWRKRWAKQKQ